MPAQAKRARMLLMPKHFALKRFNDKMLTGFTNIYLNIMSTLPYPFSPEHTNVNATPLFPPSQALLSTPHLPSKTKKKMNKKLKSMKTQHKTSTVYSKHARHKNNFHTTHSSQSRYCVWYIPGRVSNTEHKHIGNAQ